MHFNKKSKENANTHHQIEVTSKIRQSPSLPFEINAQNIQKIDDELLKQLSEGQNGEYYVAFLSSKATEFTTPKIYISSHRHMFIIYNDQSIDINSLRTKILPIVFGALSDSFLVQTTSSSDKIVEVRNSAEFKITFSLLQDDSGWPSPILSWPFEQFSQRHLKSFLEKVGIMSRFSVDSQIKHFVPLLRSPQLYDSPDDKHYYFETSDLSYILSHPNEWNSDFTSTWQPSLNFIVYIPGRSVSPLILHTSESSNEKSKTNSFLIPQTGGILIFNRQENITSQSLSEEEMTSIMQVFISQLRHLLGVSDYHRLIGSNNIQDIFPSYFDGIASWETDVLFRKRTTENIQYTATTLYSLSQLIQKLTNMVILDNIQTIVLESISSLQSAKQNIEERDFENAQKESLNAMEHAREAFFDPNMLGHLYFPDEHIFAVYAPLFLPISYPFFSKLISELKRRKEKKKRQAEKKQN